MTLKEKIVAVLEERSFEIKDGASRLHVVDATDFEQISMDIVEILGRDYSFEAEE